LRESEDSRPRTFRNSLRIPGYSKPSNNRKGKRSKSEMKFGIGSRRGNKQHVAAALWWRSSAPKSSDYWKGKKSNQNMV